MAGRKGRGGGRAGERRRGGAKSAWAQGLLLGALAVTAPEVAVMAGVLLLPGLVAVAVAAPGWRAEARAVLLAGLAASIGPLVMLWRAGPGIGGALAALGQSGTLSLAWGAAGLAWLAAEAAPLLLAAAMEARVAGQLARLRDEHAALAADWTALGRERGDHGAPAGLAGEGRAGEVGGDAAFQGGDRSSLSPTAAS